VARGKLTNDGLENVEVIWRQVPKVSGGNHFGSRLVFARDGTLFITTGERFQYRDSAQVLTTRSARSYGSIATAPSRPTILS
jgi:glucose/arabinose dehydrogenase